MRAGLINILTCIAGGLSAACRRVSGRISTDKAHCLKITRSLPQVISILFALAVLSPLSANAGAPDSEALRRAVGASVKAEGVQLDDYALVDQNGVRFNLGGYFRDGRPLVLGFIYTKCPDVCPAVTGEFKRSVDAARAKFGDRFNVLNIGFDPENDTPKRLKEYGLHYTEDFSRFRLASGDAPTIERLLAQAGFFRARNAQGGFDHMDMATVVRPDGTIYKQVYGVRTRGAEIQERLDELLTGKPPIGANPTILEKLKFFCYRYDPYTGRYIINYPVLAAFFIQLAVILVIVYAVWGRSIRGFLGRKIKGGRAI